MGVQVPPRTPLHDSIAPGPRPGALVMCPHAGTIVVSGWLTYSRRTARQDVCGASRATVFTRCGAKPRRPEENAVKRWWPLVALATAQFVMVLDQSVMNVSISTLVKDFDTTVTTIQAVITFYCLVMAMFMLTGAKIGDIIGRRRAFFIGLGIYGCGSALTAVSQSVAMLTLGWSILEGIGAALVLPALAALIAGNFEGEARKGAYAVIGGVAGAGIAVGPILGGWATTELSWRVVFAGEVVVALGILIGTRLLREPKREGTAPRLDWVGGTLSALGLGLLVLGVLQSSNWGWLL